jgi:transcriptional regulator with GAF, ATPase, and Fis domain
MMVTDGRQSPQPGEEVYQILELAQRAVLARNLKQFTERALPAIAEMMRSPSVLLYIVDARVPARELFHYGFDPKDTAYLKELCARQFDITTGQNSLPAAPADRQAARETAASLVFYPLRDEQTCFGLLGLLPPGDSGHPALLEEALHLIANTINRLGERVKIERQLTHLNAYLTVSSMLSQSMGLHELLETALYCSMEVVGAEAASILLLDDDKKNLIFYQVEGPTKPALMSATLEADKGIAGSVLQTQQSEVINDVQSDLRFYGNIDATSGFRTRNMIAIPLVAGEERIGVLEVINKANMGAFSEEDHLLLCSISEEIAFAIRNAKVFEYVASTYCKQRQGEASCKGCTRPLGSWTPCVKYRQSGL